VIAAPALTLAIAACGSTSSSTQTNAPIPIAVNTSLTGAYSIVGAPQLDGAELAVSVVNAAGGVLGHQLKLFTGDNQSDPVEAKVVCARLIQSDNIVASIGPGSIVLTPCIPGDTAAKVVAFNDGGDPSFDANTNQYLFRNEPSDGTTGLAMGVFGGEKGYKTGVLMMEQNPSAQSFKAPVTKAFEANGGHIIGSVDVQPGLSSYRTQVEQVIALHPDVIFTETPSAGGPIFADFHELNNLAIPFIGSDSTIDPNYVKAIGGNSIANKALTSLASSSPSGSSYAAFASAFQAKFNTAPAGDAPNTYDAVILIALAMDEAHTFTGSAISSNMLKVSNPPGTPCDTYATCAHLISSGQKTQYMGVDGSNVFNSNHNIFTNYDAVKDSLTGQFQTVATVTLTAITNASEGKPAAG
jgi:ABC-type branched-subunit amino acid transport system substrate-binding protein